MGKILHPRNFPFCPSTDQSAIWPNDPLSVIQLGPLDLTTAMAVFWRVRRWNIFSQQTLTILGEEGFRDTEEQIMCNSADGFNYNISLEPYDPIGEEAVQFNFYIFFNISFVVRIGSQYWLNVGAVFPSTGELTDVGVVNLSQLHFYYEFFYPGPNSSYRFEIKPLEWFSFGGTWDTSTGQRL